MHRSGAGVEKPIRWQEGRVKLMQGRTPSKTEHSRCHDYRSDASPLGQSGSIWRSTQKQSPAKSEPYQTMRGLDVETRRRPRAPPNARSRLKSNRITTYPVIAEPISKSDLGANQNSAVELKEVPLIGCAYDVVVVKYPLWRSNAECKRVSEISGVCATCKSEYRLLEIGLRSQLERGEKIGIVRLRIGHAASGCCNSGIVGNDVRRSAWPGEKQSTCQRANSNCKNRSQQITLTRTSRNYRSRNLLSFRVDSATII